MTAPRSILITLLALLGSCSVAYCDCGAGGGGGGGGSGGGGGNSSGASQQPTPPCLEVVAKADSVNASLEKLKADFNKVGDTVAGQSRLLADSTREAQTSADTNAAASYGTARAGLNKQGDLAQQASTTAADYASDLQQKCDEYAAPQVASYQKYALEQSRLAKEKKSSAGESGILSAQSGERSGQLCGPGDTRAGGGCVVRILASASDKTKDGQTPSTVTGDVHKVEELQAANSAKLGAPDSFTGKTMDTLGAGLLAASAQPASVSATAFAPGDAAKSAASAKMESKAGKGSLGEAAIAAYLPVGSLGAVPAANAPAAFATAEAHAPASVHDLPVIGSAEHANMLTDLVDLDGLMGTTVREKQAALLGHAEDATLFERVSKKYRSFARKLPPLYIPVAGQ